MSRDSDNTGATTDSSEALASLRTYVVGLLEPRFQTLITELTDHLFNISGSAQLTSEQRSNCFEAFSTVKSQSKHLNKVLTARIDDGFSHLSDQQPKSRFSLDDDAELNLVDLEEFEDTLAIDKIVKAGNERYWLQWEAIVFRVAAMLDCDAKTLNLPFAIKPLCTHYRETIRPLGFNRFIVGELDRAFARNLLPELGKIYSEIGAHLAESGLLPDIEQELEQSGSRLNPAKASAKPVERSAPPEAPPPGAGLRPPPETQRRPGASGDALRAGGSWLSDANVSDTALSAASRVTPGMATGSAALAMQPVPERLDTQQLFAAPSMTHDGPSFLESDTPLIAPSALDALAGDSGNVSYLPGRGDQQLGHTVDSEVINRLGSGAGYGGSAPLLSPEELTAKSAELAGEIATLRQQGIVANSREGSLVQQLRLDELGPEAEPLRASVQLVEDLYSTFRNALAVGEGMSEKIDLLKLPLAELSLTDPGFLSNREHPARMLVERLSELTSLSPDHNPRMESRVADILSEVSGGFDGDVGIFDQALSQVTELALGLLKQQQRNIQRSVAAEQGREKRSDAAVLVERALQAALPNARLPDKLLALIDGVLRDQWILNAVKGADEAALGTQIEPTARLNTALLQVAEGEARFTADESTALVSAVRDGVDDTGYMPPEQIALFDAINGALLGQAATELVPSTLGVTDTFAEPGFSERLKRLPRLRRWVRRARELEASSWLVEALPEGGQRNLQLIYQDADRTQFAFSNEQGQKVREVNVVQLAHWLSTRLTPLNPSEKLSIIERSVFTTLARKQTDLTGEEIAGDEDSLNRVELIDRAQSMLRRARRRGASHSAIAVHTDGDQLPLSLGQALEQININVVARGQLSPSTQGFIVDSVTSESLQQAVRDGLDAEADAGIGIAAIDPDYDSADELWRSVEDTAKRGLALAPNTGVIAEREASPTDLAGAVETTYERLKNDMPPRLSLRRVLRTRTTDSSQIEEAFQVLLDGMPDAGGEMARSAGYHSSALSIALDYIKVSSACRMAEDLTGASRAVPVFNVRISTDAALHDDFLEFVLNEVSESGIGTDRLCLEFRDSNRLREESKVADFARTLRSIGCLIAICDVNPARGSTSQLQIMSPHMLALDASLWPPAEGGERLPALHQAISDLHHLVGEHVVLRDNRDRPAAAQVGIDFVEFFDPDEIEPPQLAEHLPAVQR